MNTLTLENIKQYVNINKINDIIVVSVIVNGSRIDSYFTSTNFLAYYAYKRTLLTDIPTGSKMYNYTLKSAYFYLLSDCQINLLNTI